MKKCIGYGICAVIVMILGYYFSLGMTMLTFNQSNSSKEIALSAMTMYSILFLAGVVVVSTIIIVKEIKDKNK